MLTSNKMVTAERGIGIGIMTPPKDGTTNHHLQLDLRETVIGDTRYIAPTYEDMRRATFALARQIDESGESFDRVVTVAKGGLTWTRPLMDHLKMQKVSMIRVEGYKGEVRLPRPELTEGLPDWVDVEGKRILLFDEVVDSGKSTLIAKAHIAERGASDVSVATLVYKPRALDETGVQADFSAINSNAWIVFPHENREFIDDSTLKWLRTGLSPDLIKERLRTIGLPMDEVDYYVDLMIAESEKTPELLLKD